MSLTLYKDETLTEQISDEGEYFLPDEEQDVDGDSGEVRITPLFLGIEQTKLSEDIDDQTETIKLDAPRFNYTQLKVIIIGTEKIKIGSGGGTNTLTNCERGFRGTTPASHSKGDPVYLGYDIDNAKIEPVDTDTPPDESGWFDYCLDDGEGNPDGNYSKTLNLGTISYNEKKAIHRRITVPSGQSAQKKTDIVHKPSGDLKEHKFS